MTNHAELQIGLKYGQLPCGKIMQVSMTHKNITKALSPTRDNRLVVSEFVSLPDDVILTFSGKDLDNDTKLDAMGNIVTDLFVEIESLSLSGFSIPKEMFYHLFKLETTQGKIIPTYYIGFNGIIKLELCKDSVFSQVMSWKNSDRLTQN